MPLITCPDCQREISDSAPACPGCGRPQGVKRPDVLVANKDGPPIPSKRKRGRTAVRFFLLFHIIGLALILGLAFLNDRGALDNLKVPANLMPSLNMDLEAQGEQLVRRLGDGILNDLSKVSPACRRFAKIDAVTTSKDWIFSKTGTASLFISGQNDSVIKIDYNMQSAGEKVYVGPKDPAAGQLSVLQFGLSGCG